MALAGGLALGGHVAWFYLPGGLGRGSLVREEEAAIAAARAAAGRHARLAAACNPYASVSAGPVGLLEAASIGLRAPVLEGVGDQQLDVAVGHVPGSVWPGQAGTSVLVAHDVTYFSQVGQLSPGTTVDFVTPCATYVYAVAGHQVVTAGTPVYSNPDQFLLVLDTCYPPNA
ncbi:MAG TPA: sortase, partial [Acidimicrobiales bacterium]|nr:sortase [Acidimicrobiales bacterium]